LHRLERNGRFLWRGECIGTVTKHYRGTKRDDVEWKFTPQPHFRKALRLHVLFRPKLRELTEDIRAKMVELEREHARAAEQMGKAPSDRIRS
jgi:hypothetical protein